MRCSPATGAACDSSERGEIDMITRFGSLFAGHVDLDNEDFDGTPTNER